MKNLQNLKGVKTLNKQEQQTINGGGGSCVSQDKCEQRCNLYGGHCSNLIGTECYYCLGGGPA